LPNVHTSGREGPKFLKWDNLDEFSLDEIIGVTDALIVGKSGIH
jgi:hypothetical protein